MRKTAFELSRLLIPAVITSIGLVIGTIAINKKNSILLEEKRIESHERVKMSEILSIEKVKMSEIESNEKIKMAQINRDQNLSTSGSISGNNDTSGSSMLTRNPNESNDNTFMDYINSFIEYIDSLETIQLYSMSILIFAFVILWCLITIFIEGFIYNSIPENVDKYGKLNKYIKVVLNQFKSASRGVSYTNVIIMCISLLFIILESAYMLF
jgi:hypothetical protein